MPPLSTAHTTYNYTINATLEASTGEPFFVAEANPGYGQFIFLYIPVKIATGTFFLLRIIK